VRDETGQIVKWVAPTPTSRTRSASRKPYARVRHASAALHRLPILSGITSTRVGREVTVEANEAFLQMTGFITQEDIDRKNADQGEDHSFQKMRPSSTQRSRR